MINYDVIRKNIIQIMDEKNIIRAELARRLGVESSYITNILKTDGKGKRNIGEKIAKKISVALGVDRKELYRGALMDVPIQQLLMECGSEAIQEAEIIDQVKHELNILDMAFYIMEHGTDDQKGLLIRTMELITRAIDSEKKGISMVKATSTSMPLISQQDAPVERKFA